MKKKLFMSFKSIVICSVFVYGCKKAVCTKVEVRSSTQKMAKDTNRWAKVSQNEEIQQKNYAVEENIAKDSQCMGGRRRKASKNVGS